MPHTVVTHDLRCFELFLSLYYFSLCVAERMLVEKGGSAPSWDEERNCPMGQARSDSVGATVCRLGHAVPYLQTGLETGLCFYRDWQKSPLMAAWTLGSALGKELCSSLALSFTSSDSVTA